MRIILSPAKKMREDAEDLVCQGYPVFPAQTEKLMHWLQGMSVEELKKLWNCNDKIVEQNIARLSDMKLTGALTPAILSYDGIAYQYMAPSVFANGEFAYVQEHLRILSAFYGVVKPMDGVTPYRLEMGAKVVGRPNLYEFWGDLLYREVMDESRILINLASKEYSKCIERYLTAQDTMITCVFGELIAGKVVQKGVYAKMARGEMVRFMAENQVQSPEELRKFDRLGYCFEESLSDEKQYVFLKASEKQSTDANRS